MSESRLGVGPISPLPWKAVYHNGPYGYIRVIDRDGKDVGIDAFPSRPGCDSDRVRASVLAMIDIVNHFHSTTGE